MLRFPKINPLMPGGNKKVTHKQTCSSKLHVSLNICDLFVTARLKVLIPFSKSCRSEDLKDSVISENSPYI